MTAPTPEELQRVWDTILLQSWRSDLKLQGAVNEFRRVTGEKITDHKLRRIPPLGFPWYVSVRVFVAERLEKISNRMWSMPPERDAALVDKLQGSTYDTADQRLNPDAESAKEKRWTAKNRQKVTLETTNYAKRNKKTDWSTVK